MAQRKGGTISFSINGQRYDAKGSFSYNLGVDKKEAIVGADAVHGFKSMPQQPFIEGAITDAADLDLAALMSIEDATVTLTLANGKLITLFEAWNNSEGTATSEEGEIAIRFEGLRAVEN
jgi:hypothetical protein